MNSEHQKKVENILSTCFWEYNFKKEDIFDLANSKHIQKRTFLFEKILANSDNLLSDIQIFSKKNLLELIKDYRVPQFNFNFLNRRYLITKYYFIGEKVNIPELSWEK